MLVYHTYPELVCRLRVFYIHGFVLEVNLAAVLRVYAIEDLHEGCLSRSVFPDQSVNFPVLHGKVHRVISQHPGEAFANSFHTY